MKPGIIPVSETVQFLVYGPDDSDVGGLTLMPNGFQVYENCPLISLFHTDFEFRSKDTSCKRSDLFPLAFFWDLYSCLSKATSQEKFSKVRLDSAETGLEMEINWCDGGKDVHFAVFIPKRPITGRCYYDGRGSWDMENALWYRHWILESHRFDFFIEPKELKKPMGHLENIINQIEKLTSLKRPFINPK